MNNQQEMEQLAEKGKAIIDCCEIEGRARTPAEERQMGDIFARLKELREEGHQKGVNSFLAGDNTEEVRVDGVTPAGDLGRSFVASKGYKSIQSAAGRGQTWSSGAVEVPLQTKGTLMEGSVAGTMVPAQYQPGIVSKLFQPVGLADYFGQAQTTSSHVRYVLEGTATSGAAGVAEGGTKPESTFNYSEVDEPVKKIATTLPISDELLEDAVAVQSYLNNRLSLFLTIEEERQLLLGAGTNELVGITGRLGINTYGTAAGGTIPAELIFKAAAGSRGSAFLDPDLVIMNPTNWGTIRLAKDTAGQYLGGGPWQGQYGGPQNPVSTGYFSSSPLWNMNVWVTTAVGVGTAIVGNFKQAASIIRRGGPTVEATNSHSDWFTKDLSMIRAEERLALAVYRPASFVVCSF